MEHLKGLLSMEAFNTIEILFEDIAFQRVLPFLNQANGYLVDYRLAGNFQTEKHQNGFETALKIFEERQEADLLYLNFRNFELANYTIEKLGAHVYRYNSTVDLTLCVEEKFLERIALVPTIQAWAKKVAQQLDAHNYLCGLEPASDYETRFFTADQLGPLK